MPALELDPPAHRTGRASQWWTAKRDIWLDALGVWLASRALLLALTVLVPALAGRGGRLGDLPGALRVWYTQDAARLLAIAQHGYTQPAQAAFFPLLPLLEHLLAPLTGGDAGLAGLVVANAAFLVALIVLRDLLEHDFGADLAHRAILYLALFPAAFFFFAPTSQSLYLCLSLAAFAALRQRRWWLGGALGGIAALARSPAVLLLLPFAVEFLVARRYRLVHWWESLAALLIPAGTALYAIYLQIRFQNPTAFFQAHANWTQSASWPGESVVASIGALASGADPVALLAHVAPDLAVLVLCLVLGGLALTRLPLNYGLYAAALLLYFLFIPPASAGVALQGQEHLLIPLFPAVILLAQWGERERLHETLLLAQVALLALLVIHFTAVGAAGITPVWW